MIAKSGILVGTVAAGLVALSPLAYAACNGGHHGSSHHGNDHGRDHGHHYVQADYRHNNHGGGNGDRGCSQQTHSVNTGGHGGGLINLSGNSIQVPVQACNNNILSNLGLGILGNGSARNR